MEETPVEGIVLDTGAAKTMIHRDLVPVEKVSREIIDIQCALAVQGVWREQSKIMIILVCEALAVTIWTSSKRMNVRM